MKLKTLVGICMALSVNFSSVAMASYGKVADNTVSAYRNSSLSQRTGNERVDRGDLVHVLEERDNAYYVRYPVKNGTKDRWVPKNIFNSSPTVKLNNGWYRIQPMHDLRRSLDAYGAQIGGGNNIHMWDSLDVDQQKFYLQNRGNGFFSLQSAASKLYVTANGSNGGANLYTSGWSGADTQQFCLLNAGGGSYYIICKAGDNLTFDCAGGGKANGTNVGLWWKDNDTTAWYKWKLTGVNVKQSTPTPTPTTQRGYINTQSLNLNLRRTPNGAIIGKLAKNTPVTILQGNSNGWTKVQTDSGQVGYVSSQYVAIGEVPKNITPSLPTTNGNVALSPSGYAYPLGEKTNFPNGHDCSKPEGTPVYAVESGTAIFSQVMGTYGNRGYATVSYGNYIQLKCDNGAEARYGHLSRFEGVELKYKSIQNKGSTHTACKNYGKQVLASRHVNKGDIIGYVGTTGNSTGNHLHFEFYIGGQRQNVNNYFNK